MKKPKKPDRNTAEYAACVSEVQAALKSGRRGKTNWQKIDLVGCTSSAAMDEDGYVTVPGCIETRHRYPFVAQVFPTYTHEPWDRNGLIPVRTGKWTARIVRLERDPANPMQPDDENCITLMRITLALNDTFKSQRTAKEGVLKLLTYVCTIWPTIERGRKKGKPLKFVPIMAPKEKYFSRSPLSRRAMMVSP